MIGIYAINNILNNKKYIGQSKNIDKRWRQHKTLLKNNKHSNRILQNSWNKYQEDSFEFSILKYCSENELNDLEQYYIKLYNSVENGFNLDYGGNVNSVTQATKDKISINNSYLNKPKHIIEKRRNIAHNSHLDECIPIFQINIITGETKHWEGARWASKQLEITQSCIWQCLEKNRITYKDCAWIYEDEYNKFNIDNYINQNTQAKKIFQYDKNGILIKVYKSSNSVKIDGYDSSAVIKCCKGKISIHKEHIWRYENDLFEKYPLKNKGKKSINQYDLNNNFIKNWDSATDVSSLYNISNDAICKALKGQSKTAGGFIWKYAD